jgi:hypothetical protein
MFEFSHLRAPLLAAVPALALLTSGCSPSYTCEHDFGLSRGTTDFSNCLVHEEADLMQRGALLSQIGHDLTEQSRQQPVFAPMAPMTFPTLNVSPPMSPPPQRHYCDGFATGNGTFSATCN